MPTFANQSAFDDTRSRMMALGINLSAARAIVDRHGHVLAHAQTGGMIAPERFELHAGQTIYRFGGGGAAPRDVAKGGWWLERLEFEKLVNFANVHRIHIGLAMRVLCIVPPEWSDATLLVRARAVHGLLAWRGLANSVVIPAGGLNGKGKGTVRLPHQNEISERRLYQLFVPGLGTPMPEPAVSIEQVFHLDASEGVKGFLYL